MITAPHNDRILDGVTRKSVIQLAKDHGIQMEIRPVSVKEIKEAAQNNSLKEIFGSGTAAVISPISGFKHDTYEFELAKSEQSFASRFKEVLMYIQYNKAEDQYGWRYKI